MPKPSDSVSGVAALGLSAGVIRLANPILIVVTFPAIEAGKIVAPMMTVQATKKLGQAVAVDNKPTADAGIGGTHGAVIAPDGYTPTALHPALVSTGSFAMDKLPDHPDEGLAHIAMMGSGHGVGMPSHVSNQVAV